MPELMRTNNGAAGKTSEKIAGQHPFTPIRLKKRGMINDLLIAGLPVLGLFCCAFNHYLFFRELALSGAIIGMALYLKRRSNNTIPVNSRDISAN